MNHDAVFNDFEGVLAGYSDFHHKDFFGVGDHDEGGTQGRKDDVFISQKVIAGGVVGQELSREAEASGIFAPLASGEVGGSCENGEAFFIDACCEAFFALALINGADPEVGVTCCWAGQSQHLLMVGFPIPIFGNDGALARKLARSPPESAGLDPGRQWQPRKNQTQNQLFHELCHSE